MAVYYLNSGREVLIGDHVEVSPRVFFWSPTVFFRRKWKPGRIHYVPGISPKNTSLEYNGLTWVAIEFPNGEQTGILVEPDTHELQKIVRFVSRSTDGFTKPNPDYYFGDGDDEGGG